MKHQIDDDRKELYRRRECSIATITSITRLHHRVSEETLPTDVGVGPPSGGLQGGVLLPTGPKGDIPIDVKPDDAERMQTRYLFFHPWKGMQACEKPERWRWGKPPRTYRGLRKIWVVEDLARKSRTQIKPADVVRTPLPEFGLTGEPPKPVGDGGPDAGLEGGSSRRGCHCAIPGGARGRNAAGARLLALLGAVSLLRRRRG